MPLKTNTFKNDFFPFLLRTPTKNGNLFYGAVKNKYGRKNILRLPNAASRRAMPANVHQTIIDTYAKIGGKI